MEILIHLSLIQKNLRCLQNYRHLRESMMTRPMGSEELRIYLQKEEPFFFREICERPAMLSREREELSKLKEKPVR